MQEMVPDLLRPWPTETVAHPEEQTPSASCKWRSTWYRKKVCVDLGWIWLRCRREATIPVESRHPVQSCPSRCPSEPTYKHELENDFQQRGQIGCIEPWSTPCPMARPTACFKSRRSHISGSITESFWPLRDQWHRVATPREECGLMWKSSILLSNRNSWTAVSSGYHMDNPQCGRKQNFDIRLGIPSFLPSFLGKRKIVVWRSTA